MAEIILCAAVVALLAVFGRTLTKQGLKAMLNVAILAGLATVGRVAMTTIPTNTQPASFIVMMSGMLFGPGAGLVCGVITGFLSNLLIGMLWPFCAWHMLLWGAMGLLAGVTRKVSFRAQAAIGFAWGFVFDWCMNLWWYTTGALPFSWGAFIAVCITGIYFDLAHALTNFTLLLFFSQPLRRLFSRAGSGGE